MRSISSVFWSGLQADNVELCELIELTTSTETFRWATTNAPLQVGSYTYDPFPGMAGRGSEESSDLGVGTVEFGLANSGSINSLLMSNQLASATVTVSRVFTNSPNLGRMYIFRGQVGDLSYTRDHISGMIRNKFSGVTGRWPYFTYQDKCVWRFGSTGCGIDVANYTVTTTANVNSSNPYVLVALPGSLSGTYAPGILEKGKVTVLTGVNSGHVRSVRANTGDLLVLSHPLPYQLDASFGFQIHPGCRKRYEEDCVTRYNNGTRFLGFPWIPKTEAAF